MAARLLDRRIALTALLALLGLALAPSALAQEDAAPAARIQEWTVPWPDTRPRDPYLAPDGRVWFVGQAGNYLAVFTPATESFERFDLPEGTKPHTVVVDRQGRPWIAGNGNGTILRFDEATATFETYRVPETEGIGRLDPHTFTFDGRGGLWFTLQRGNGIGHLDIASGGMRLVPVPTANALPYGILADASGRPWAVLLGTNKLATVDPDTLQVREIDLPRADARPRRLGLTRDGKVWYGDYSKGHVGVYDPDTGDFSEWKAPSAPSGPYAFAVDARGRPWFFETHPQPNLLQALDPETGEFLPATPVPSGGRSVRHMVYDPDTNSLWFGTDSNTLGKANLPM